MGAEQKKGLVLSGKLWIAVGILTVALGTALFSGYFLLLKNNIASETDYGSYEYHIAVIADETDNMFWKNVCEGAVAAGKDYGAYVEQTGGDLVEQFSVEDAINMAIYEGVDGILLRPSETGVSEAMIDKAYLHGIPVITMQKDVPNSRRRGFVGINDYFLGQEYGKRVLKLAEGNTRLVTVLFPGTGFNETSQNWFRQGLQNTLLQEQIQFDFQIIRDDRGLNNAEDVIHEITEGMVEQPDIIICLNEVITQSASQMIRDRGLSSQIKVIGSYVSDYIIEGIQNGSIDSTITIDAEAMGRMSIEALMTYKKHHMVSYYTEVDTMLIDQSLAAMYGKGDGKDTDVEK